MLLVVGIAWYQDAFDALLPPNAWARHCEPTRLNVVADPSIAPALTKSAADFDAVTSCVKTTVRAQESADTASLLAVGGNPHADVWVPDSDAWEPRSHVTAWSLIRPAPAADFGASIATSPIVLAVPTKDADAWGTTKPSWAPIANGSIPTLLPEPAVNGASLVALARIKDAEPAGDSDAFAGTMIRLGKNIPSSPDDAFAAAETSSTVTPVITTEQSVVAHNASSPSHQFFATYPSDGTVAVSYPFVRVAGPTTGDSHRDELIAALQEQFTTSTRPLAAAGFRTPHPSKDFAANGVIAATPATRPALDGGAQVALLQEWSAITVRSRMLVVVDVSGSMTEDAGGGLTRIGVFQHSATDALQMFSPQSQIGLWDFSTNQVGTQPWKELSPIAPIGDPAHAADLSGIIGELPSLIRGDTGLYDTTLAAVKAMRASYNSKMINSVLVITDGANENPSGITLDSLLEQLKAGNDPSKPVPVIMVGLGPDTDVPVMSQIAAATVGGAYTAEQPQDLGHVLVDALSQRTCRPYCS